MPLLTADMVKRFSLVKSKRVNVRFDNIPNKIKITSVPSRVLSLMLFLPLFNKHKQRKANKQAG